MATKKNALNVIIIAIVAIYVLIQMMEGKGHSYYRHELKQVQKQVDAINERLGEDDSYVFCSSVPSWTASWWDGTCEAQ